MADIKDYITRIESAIRGEDVRDAIVAVLELINNGDANSFTLNGHPASYFAKQEDLDALLPIAQEAIAGNQHPISSGGVYDILVKILDAIAKILGEDVSGDMRTQLEYLNDIKKNIRYELIAKQVSVDKDTKFSEYPNLIKQIPVTAEVQVESLNISENGEYEAKEGRAYNPVVVNVKPNVKSKTINETGTFKAKDDDCDGYSEVSVNIQGLPEGTKPGTKMTLTKKTITATDIGIEGKSVTFSAEDDKCIGYSSVTVNPAGLVNEKIDSMPIGENNEIILDAKDDNLLGYSHIEIRLQEPEGPFNVEFWNGNVKIWETGKIVMPHQSVTYGGPTPTKDGQVFIGWNPTPTDIVRDTKCYAMFDKKKPEPGAIDMDWNEIVACRGDSRIAIGSWKKIGFRSSTYGGIEVPGGELTMYKVYEGENGTTSSWLSKEEFPKSLPFYTCTVKNGNPNANGWENSDLRKYLNDTFPGLLKSGLDYDYCDALNNATSVSKFTRTVDLDTFGVVGNHATTDKFFVPSMKELSQGGNETHGVVYDLSKPGGGGIQRSVYEVKTSIISDKKTVTSITVLEQLTSKAIYVYNPNDTTGSVQKNIEFRIGFCL